MTAQTQEPALEIDADTIQSSPVDPTDERLKDLRAAIDVQDVDTAQTLIEDLHAADKAELFNSLDEQGRQLATDMLSDCFDSDILPELTADAAEDVIETLGPERSAEVLGQLETDDAIHVMEDLSAADQATLLEQVEDSLREELQEGLAYPEESAGRLMTKKLLCVPEFWTVGDIIDHMRQRDDLPENFYVVYVTDPKFRPVGRVQLSKMMHAKRVVKVSDIMSPDIYEVDTEMDQEDVAHKFRKYGLVETPVVNQEGKLVGTITVDDVVHVIKEEEEEDYLRAGGVKSQDLQMDLYSTVKQRFPWLFINLLTAVAASIVIGLYEETIEQLVVLAVLMPIVASMGGNAGTQSVTVAVRALATKQLKSSNSFTVMRKELTVGLINGLGLAAIMAGGSYAMYHDLWLATVFGIATIVTLMIAGLSGALIPIVLNRLNIDPAVSSSVFLTTVTDIVGFFAFLGMATMILL